ncbi:MAG: methionyl-tRNA formyltransferase [Thermoanaerobaculia bacterium]|nr:methionyl-tRNA formyltransferase [Thermoanaerobaculia bacterium]
MRVVYFGTPDFAVPTLEALAATDDLKPLLVISQPSRPVGRGRQIKPPPVAQRASALGLDLEQVPSVRDLDFVHRLGALQPDVAVVVAFGQIFHRGLLELPSFGCVNLHASLLPAYRGAAPVHAAIAAGDTVTGVTTMQMERGLDSGPVLLRAETNIAPDETTATLGPRLAGLGAELMVTTLRGLWDGTVTPTPQNDGEATYAPKIDKEDGLVDWRMPAASLYDLWRAYQPWPGLTATLNDEPVKLVEVRPLTGLEAMAPPGTILDRERFEPTALGTALPVACGGDTILAARRLQRPGKSKVTGADFANGERLAPGIRFDVRIGTRNT